MVKIYNIITFKINFNGKISIFVQMAERSIKNLQHDGGCVVFDFTNTINTRTTAEAHDYLKNYADILSWSGKADILPAEKIKSLTRYASAHVDESSIAFKKAIRAREALYPMFSAIARAKTPDKRILDEFNMILSDCFSKIQLKISTSEVTPGFTNNTVLLDEPLCVIVKSAYDILTQENFQRLKECPRCGWLFIDRTKNGKRRWCDMQVCGSRSKATRYYHKKKEESKS